MRIADLQVWNVNVPMTSAFQTSFDRRTGTTRTIVRMTSDSGHVGWGETFRGAPTRAIIERLRDTLIGWNPYEQEKLRARLHMTPFFYGYVGYAALAGIEMAFLDLIGHATGQSIADMIGGAIRDRIKVTGVVTTGLVPRQAAKDPEALAEAADAFRGRYGFSALKLKGSSDTRQDIALVTAMRERMPTTRLRLDPNAAWSVPDSIWGARRLLPLDLEYLEDPCPGLEGMAQVRKAVGIPLCTNMCVVRLEEVAPAIRMGAVDVIHGDVHKWGGVGPTRRLAAICDAFGLGMNMHSGGELGLSTACHLQVAAATPEIRYAIDTIYYLIGDDIVQSRFTIDDGMMTVPTGPGLGVAVDLDKLEHYAAQHARDGDLVG